MSLFVNVVDEGSFSAAGRALAIPKSTISRRITRLEERLGARLLHRSTRSLGLTEAGRIYLQNARQIIAQVEEAEDAVRELRATPRGQLTMSAPLGTINPNINALGAAFMHTYPGVSLRVILTNRPVDLIAEGIDVAFRATEEPLKDSSLIARRLMQASRVLCASPSYLKAHGYPKTLTDLSNHDMLLDETSAPGDRLIFPQHDPIPVRCRLKTNNSPLLHYAALAGLGIAFLPTINVASDLSHGRLEQVLSHQPPPQGWIYILYPDRRHLPAKVRVFIDFVTNNVAHFTLETLRN